jgi:hypothetical protein
MAVHIFNMFTLNFILRKTAAKSLALPLAPFVATLISSLPALGAPENLLQNPGFEADGPGPAWTTPGFSETNPKVSDQQPHSGRFALTIPARSAVEQTVGNVRAGAYLARGWVKSPVAQSVTLMLQDPKRPWAAYACAELKVPKSQWTQIEVECPLDQDGSLSLTLGGTSSEFRSYHGAGAEMKSPIVADDFELVRYEPPAPAGVNVWDAPSEVAGALSWPAGPKWEAINGESHAFTGSPAFQTRQLAGCVRKEDGAVVIYAIHGQGLKKRGVIAPVQTFKPAGVDLVKEPNRTGLRVRAESGAAAYTVWLMPVGGVKIEADGVGRFAVREVRSRHGLLPSFAGTDVHYDSSKMTGVNEVCLPSTQWFVGLADGNDGMMVAVWDKDSQAVSMGLSGDGKNRLIESLSIDTEHGGFAVSFVEHTNIWREEPLLEDWLGEYTPIGWQRPFAARWMADFFATRGGKPSFHEPFMEYSFPVANARTRMWGVWFEDWNHYPFYFDGTNTVAHFEKSFIPNGNALIYFLEPAAADLYSPTEIVEAALGKEKALALFDPEANRLRQLTYSTPPDFMYDRPVCATTTHLSHIKKEERATVGVNLATHLFEFIREIRGRVDQYNDCFKRIQARLDEENAAHPELGPYVAGLEKLLRQARSEAEKVYVTPLAEVKEKSDGIKKRLIAGSTDGFDCAELDVRGPAGEQDDLCRRYNRLVLRLEQTAALNCGDSPEKAVIAKFIWDQSREVLRRPSRWESRRTLYFFEP